MEIKILKNENEYKVACKRLYELFQIEDLSAKPDLSDEFDIVSLLVEDYEKKYYPIEYPTDPIEAINFKMDQMGLSKKELSKIFGYSSRVSEIFSKKRKLNLAMIRKLNTELKIPLESLIISY